MVLVTKNRNKLGFLIGGWRVDEEEEEDEASLIEVMIDGEKI